MYSSKLSACTSTSLHDDSLQIRRMRSHSHIHYGMHKHRHELNLLADGGTSARLVTTTVLHNGSARIQAASTSLARAATNNLTMHSARNTIVHLQVDLGKLIVVDDARVDKVTKRALVNNVAHGKALDRFVLSRLAVAPIASDRGGVVATVAITAVITTLHSHLEPRVGST